LRLKKRIHEGDSSADLKVGDLLTSKAIKENKQKVKLRQQLSEHPFGTLKRGFGQGYLLLKGLRKVGEKLA
jgi:hypothetical protein